MGISLKGRHPRSLLYARSQALLTRMHGPLCGLNQMIGLSNRAQTEPQFFVLGGELTGVHVLLNRPTPKPNSYHIGGTGIVLEEALIRTLGETIERYCQMVGALRGHSTRIASYNEMIASGEPVVDREKLKFFTFDQLARNNFPFAPFDSDMPLTWIITRSLTSDQVTWVPSQILIVGYTLQKREQRFYSSVTTGTAAHTSQLQAARSALLELIQLILRWDFGFPLLLRLK